MADLKEKLRIGLIGCGGISGAHLPHLTKSEDVEIVGFCDVVVDRAEKKAAKYVEELTAAGRTASPKTYDDAAKMLADIELDAAYILIPTYAHGTPEREVIKKGLPFLVEKPLGINPEDLRKLAVEVEASGVISSAGFMNRYRQSVNRVRDILSEDPAILIDGAWIGGPPLVKEGDYFSQNPIGQWWPIKEKSGGQMVEQVIHTVDLIRYLAGDPVEVFAYGATGFNSKLPNIIPNYNLEDAAVFALKFANGTVANIMSCCAAQTGGGIFLNIWASKHTAKFTEWAHHVTLHTAGEKETEDIKGDLEDIFPTEDRAFINAVKSGDRSGIRCTHKDGANSTLLALACNESIALGKPVTVQYV